MPRPKWMPRFARWHVWLGWLVGIPMLMWTVTGLVMVARPIDEVRGEHLSEDMPEQMLPAVNPPVLDFPIENAAKYSEMRAVMQDDRPIWLLTREDGTTERLAADMNDAPLPEIDEAYVRSLVARRIVGGEAVATIASFTAEQAPLDLRRAIPSWQVALKDGTNVYIHAQTGEIAAVRTRFWRVFDFMWGLHIMDLETREDTSHPTLILFAVLGVFGSLLGCILMFRRRTRRVPA